MRSVRKSVWEPVVVFISSLAIGGCVGFVQFGSVVRISMAELNDVHPMILGGGQFAALVAAIEGPFLYHKFLRDRLTTGLAAKVPIASLATGVQTVGIFNLHFVGPSR